MPRVVRYWKTVRTTINALSTALFAAVLLTGCGLAHARDLSHNEALELRRSGALVPFEKILAEIERLYPGAQFLEVELEEEDDIYIYEIEILTSDYRVRELELDAASGAVLSDEIEH